MTVRTVQTRSRIRDQQIGIVEIGRYLAAAVTVVGAMVWGWNVNLVILLSLLVVASAGLCDMCALWHLRWRDERSGLPNNRFCFSGGHRTPRLDD